MRSRPSFAYVVEIEGSQVTLNLKDEHRGHVSSHRDGIVNVTDIGSLIGVEAGHRIIILKVKALSFAEPREAHRAGVGSTAVHGYPLRNVAAFVVGFIERTESVLTFVADNLLAPPLGAEAYPLSTEEVRAVLQIGQIEGANVYLGDTVRGHGPIRVGLNQLLTRHVAVLGGTGHGKSCFTAAVLQQLMAFPTPRIVIFDVNGEYADALKPHASGADALVHTILGGPEATLQIPYYALGRQGLSRLLLPSEKTQRPALAFALENLPFVVAVNDGVQLVGGQSAVLFDDCRSDKAKEANDAIVQLRAGTATRAKRWPPMNALSCLIAESHALKPGRNGIERDAFTYGNVAPLVTRVKRCVDDPMFCSVVNTAGSSADESTPLSWRDEAKKLVGTIFGDSSSKWKVHIVDLRNVAHDLMPLILGSLLELFAFELFERGQGKTFPTLLVLEEAHHYLRQFAEQEELGRQALAYERLAKEGRKFGLSLWISTQRPSEVSPTVLSQCGTWVAFRLAGNSDLQALASAAEWVDRNELGAVSGLPRQQALVFGCSIAMPARVRAPTANPTPKSHDPDFDRWTESQ